LDVLHFQTKSVSLRSANKHDKPSVFENLAPCVFLRKMIAGQKPAVAAVPIEASATLTYQRAYFQGRDLRSKKCTFAENNTTSMGFFGQLIINP